MTSIARLGWHDVNGCFEFTTCIYQGKVSYLTQVQVAQVATFGSWAEKIFFFFSSSSSFYFAPAIPDPAADQSDWSPVWILVIELNVDGSCSDLCLAWSGRKWKGSCDEKISLPGGYILLLFSSQQQQLLLLFLLFLHLLSWLVQFELLTGREYVDGPIGRRNIHRRRIERKKKRKNHKNFRGMSESVKLCGQFHYQF